MPESNISPLAIEDGALYKYSRKSWYQAGVDQFTEAPGQNPDAFTELTNILSPATNSLKRRFGYATFLPKLDTGLASNADQVSLSALYGTIFDGASGYVWTNNVVSYNETPTFSLEFWIETTSTSGGYFITQNQNQKVSTASDTQYFGIYLTTGGTIGFGWTDGSTVHTSTSSSTVVNDGFGHQVVLTVNAGTYVLYIDGVQNVTGSLSTGVGTAPVYWRFAEGAGGSGWPTIDLFAQTFLSHIAEWDGIVISGAQVAAHYAALTGTNGTQSAYETAIKNDTPTHFWKLTETSQAVPPTQNTIVQATAGFIAATGKTVVLNFASHVTKGNLIFVFGSDNNNGTGIGVTDNMGNSYTSILQNQGTYAFYTYATSAGSLSVTLTGTNNTDRSAAALELYNIVSSNPVDGKAYTQGNSTTFTSPSITTASEPDLILSCVFTVNNAAPDPTSGFVLAVTEGFQPTNQPAPQTLAIAYTQAGTAGSYSCPWIINTASYHTSMTIGLTMNAAVVPTGNTAYDTADGDNGQYQVAITSNKTAQSGTVSGATCQVVVSSYSGVAAQVGQTVIALFNIDPSTHGGGGGVSITSISDTQSNTWTPLTTGVTFTNSAGRHQLVQLWYAVLNAGIAIGGTYTVTAVTTSSDMGGDMEICVVGGISTLDQSVHNTGTGTAVSSGSITTQQEEALVSVAGAQQTFATGPAAPFFQIMGNSGGNNSQAYLGDFQAGTYADAYTTSVSSSWAAAMVSMFLFQGFVLGQYIVVQ